MKFWPLSALTQGLFSMTIGSSRAVTKSMESHSSLQPNVKSKKSVVLIYLLSKSSSSQLWTSCSQSTAITTSASLCSALWIKTTFSLKTKSQKSAQIGPGSTGTSSWSESRYSFHLSTFWSKATVTWIKSNGKLAYCRVSDTPKVRHTF